VAFRYQFEWERLKLDKNKPMKREYDFSKAARGKFYRKGTELRLPIYLDAKLQRKLEHLAQKKGKDVSEVVNQLLRKDVDVLEKLT